MNIVVQKYGGLCLETPDKVRAVAKSIADLRSQGSGVVVVVSAMGKSTDELVRLAYQISPHPNRRELDMLLSTGERISMALMSMALHDLGIPAISFTGSQAGVMTDDSHSQARIVDVKPLRVREELDRGRVVVLAGFQGVNPKTKEITTLGRGGSDTTAVAMAAALKATRCEIIKEVDGICSADPRVVKNVKSLPQLTYQTLSEMCFWGAKVLHFRCVELALSQNVPLVIRRWGQNPSQTEILQEISGMEEGRVLSVNSLSRVEHLFIDAKDLSEAFQKLEAHLKAHNLGWPQILASAYGEGNARLMVTADSEYLDTLLRTLDKSAGLKKARPTLSAVTLTCYGSVSTNLPHRALSLLAEQKIKADKYILSPHSISLFVEPEAREAAVRILHGLT